MGAQIAFGEIINRTPAGYNFRMQKCDSRIHKCRLPADDTIDNSSPGRVDS